MQFSTVRILEGKGSKSARETYDVYLKRVAASDNFLSTEITDSNTLEKLRSIIRRKTENISQQAFEAVAEYRLQEWRLLSSYTDLNLNGDFRTSFLEDGTLTYVVLKND